MITNLALSLALLIIGIGLLLYFSEKLVEATVGISTGFGVSAFLVSTIFIGFDPENLALGAVASYEGAPGIALGTIFGAGMVAISLALGITALIAPMKFEEAPKKMLWIPVASILLLASLSLDGLISRADGAVLLAGYLLAVLYLVWLHTNRGLDIRSSGERGDSPDEENLPGRWRSAGMLVLSLAAIVLGSELIVTGSESVIARLGLSETLFGMTLLALAVSFEELARELPAAMKGHAEITYGNVVGSILAFFLFNTGVIALVRPLPVGGTVLNFYLPLSLFTVLLIAGLMWFKSIPRWSGILLLLLYTLFFGYGYLL